jgi:hypothetical protein
MTELKNIRKKARINVLDSPLCFLIQFFFVLISFKVIQVLFQKADDKSLSVKIASCVVRAGE